MASGSPVGRCASIVSFGPPPVAPTRSVPPWRRFVASAPPAGAVFAPPPPHAARSDPAPIAAPPARAPRSASRRVSDPSSPPMAWTYPRPRAWQHRPSDGDGGRPSPPRPARGPRLDPDARRRAARGAALAAGRRRARAGARRPRVHPVPQERRDGRARRGAATRTSPGTATPRCASTCVAAATRTASLYDEYLPQELEDGARGDRVARRASRGARARSACSASRGAASTACRSRRCGRRR